MPPSFGGKSFVTSRHGIAAGCYEVPPRVHAARARSRTRPSTEVTAPVVKAPRFPENGDDRAAHERAEPLRHVEERGERADHRRPVGVTDAFEREQQQRGIHQRHAAREHDGADDQARERRPRGDDPDPDRGEDERDRPGVATAEPVGHPRAEDAHDEDEHAVEQEDRTGVDVELMGRVERHERAEAGERDEPEEQDGARLHRGPVQEMRRLRLGVSPVRPRR